MDPSDQVWEVNNYNFSGISYCEREPNKRKDWTFHRDNTTTCTTHHCTPSRPRSLGGLFFIFSMFVDFSFIFPFLFFIFLIFFVFLFLFLFFHFVFPHFSCVSFHFLFLSSLHSGRSKVARGTVGRDIHQPTNQNFRVCKVNLATLKVAMKPISDFEKCFF